EAGRTLELVRSRAEGPWPLGLVGPNLAPLPLDDALFAATRGRDADGHETLRFDYRGPAGSAHKAIRVLGPGLLGLEIEASTPGWGVVLGPAVRNPAKKEIEGRKQPFQGVYRSAGDVTTLAAAKVEEPTKLAGGALSWIGLEDNYFLTVLVP